MGWSYAASVNGDNGCGSGYFGRVALSCSQATSGLLGAAMSAPPKGSPPATSGGIVLESIQRLISEWPSANEKPQPRL
jgi:hypothetical protein